MSTWLVSSLFLARLADGGEVLAVSANRQRPGPDSVGHRAVSALAGGDDILLWDMAGKRLSRALVVVRDCAPGEVVPGPGCAVAVKHVADRGRLPEDLDQGWLWRFQERHPLDTGGFKLLRSGKGFFQFHRTRFCRLVPEDALASIPGYADLPGVRGDGSPATPSVEKAADVPPGAPSRGPSPWSGSGTFERDWSGPGSCYLLRFGDTDYWKVGIAKDPSERLDRINEHMPNGSGLGWRLVVSREWPDGDGAYAAEQATLADLSASSNGGEQVLAPEAVVMAAWARRNPTVRVRERVARVA